MNRPRRLLPLLTLALLAAGCAKPPPAAERGIGPLPAFSGRILVIDGERRWQAGLDWYSESPETGRLRLIHAASGRIVELAWRGERMRLRDNAAGAGWRAVGPDELRRHGIVLPPAELARLLLGRPSPRLRRTGENRWRLRVEGGEIRVVWHPGAKRLELTDLARGRRAILVIDG